MTLNAEEVAIKKMRKKTQKMDARDNEEQEAREIKPQQDKGLQRGCCSRGSYIVPG